MDVDDERIDLMMDYMVLFWASLGPQERKRLDLMPVSQVDLAKDEARPSGWLRRLLLRGSGGQGQPQPARAGWTRSGSTA